MGQSAHPIDFVHPGASCHSRSGTSQATPPSSGSLQDPPTPLEPCQDPPPPSETLQDPPPVLVPCHDPVAPSEPLQDSPPPLGPCQDEPQPSLLLQDPPSPLGPCQDEPQPSLPLQKPPPPSGSCQDKPPPSDPLQDSLTPLGTYQDPPLLSGSLQDSPALSGSPQERSSRRLPTLRYKDPPAPVILPAVPSVTSPPRQMGEKDCPGCRVGIVQEEFTACGICLGICFFPLGLVCCLLMRERRCNHCGAKFS
ncbi:MAGE-like protein 2 [Portunus trituberculatus]|uniref:MAGE-like protein 2 n=1 Tax=Portunus trituberculatus TaxID=210409 RepID=UPI001E1CDB21|nr:MAGE-like protein 2 [Portunus trituberculatus]